MHLDWVHASAGGPAGCPAVLLLGLDVAPTMALKSPTNFFGVAYQETVDETDEALTRAFESAAAAGCPRPMAVAYGHYPLSTVHYPDAPLFGRCGAWAREAALTACLTMSEVLLQAYGGCLLRGQEQAASRPGVFIALLHG